MVKTGWKKVRVGLFVHVNVGIYVVYRNYFWGSSEFYKLGSLHLCVPTLLPFRVLNNLNVGLKMDGKMMVVVTSLVLFEIITSEPNGVDNFTS